MRKVDIIFKYISSLTIPPSRGTILNTTHRKLVEVVVKHMILTKPICPVCGTRTFNRAQLKRHIATKHRDLLMLIARRIESVDVGCTKRFRQQLGKKMKVRVCPFCKMAFLDTDVCTEHLIVEHLTKFVNELIELIEHDT